jgi:hypothetical protein
MCFIQVCSKPKVPLLEKLLNDATDAASLALHLATCLLLYPDSVRDKKDLGQFILCLKTLRKDWFDQAQIKRLDSCFSLQKPRWPRALAPQLLQLLFESWCARFWKEYSWSGYDKLFSEWPSRELLQQISSH